VVRKQSGGGKERQRGQITTVPVLVHIHN